MKKVSYKVTSKRGRVYLMDLVLTDSGAFEYGNGTAVLFYDGVNAVPQLYDTRYEVGIKEHFEEWCDSFLRNMLPETTKIERRHDD